MLPHDNSQKASCKGSETTWAYMPYMPVVCSVSVISVASGQAILKNTVIISDIRTGIKMLPQPRALIHNNYQSMVGEFRRH